MGNAGIRHSVPIMTSTLHGPSFAAGAALGALSALGVARSPQARFTRMAGSSIAAPDAAGWITDFLNAAYYRRDPGERKLDDLRLAFGIVTTRWHGLGRRLRGPDVVPFHRAFGRERFFSRPRGTLDPEQLRGGAAQLLGPWFPDAWGDPGRRGWGIAFQTPEARAAYQPEVRQRHARLGVPTPPVAPEREQTWHTYPGVAVASAERVIAALSATETWPDYASEIGRFTPVRDSGLLGQTFEIEVVAQPLALTPVFTRGYVTITRLVSTADRPALDAYVQELNDGLARYGRDEPPAVPEGADAILAFDLTTHEGHFMGHSKNRLVLYERDGQAYVRAAGTWDPMPWHLEQAYQRAGQEAQHAFWGMGAPEASMLHQIALAVA
jgi:hypothetical protein